MNVNNTKLLSVDQELYLYRPLPLIPEWDRQVLKLLEAALNP